jgi:U4/U6 small nuclear ribonucleoprotein PRP4
MASHEVMDLTASSLARQDAHAALQEGLEITKLAATLVVPTLPDEVRQALRAQGEPVRLFGENLARVRDRLRILMATLQVRGGAAADDSKAQAGDDEEQQVTQYTRAEPALLFARQAITAFSLERASQRLTLEATRKEAARLARKRKKALLVAAADGADAEKENTAAVLQQWDDIQTAGWEAQQRARSWVLEASQYATTRSLSAVGVVRHGAHSLVATSSWSSAVQFFEASTLTPLGEHTLCHQDRIMGMAVTRPAADNNNNTAAVHIATASLDRTAKLWKVVERDSTTAAMTDEDIEPVVTFGLEELAHFEGHEARLCRTAFHPLQQHVATTSFDHTWRYWDMETGQCLLLQDGHWKEVFGLAFHGDGSLVATTDFGSVVQVWDLRTGKSVHHFLGHARRVLSASFAPNGFQLATAGDDGTIKVWDVRQRKVRVSIPAHSNLIGQVQFDADGESLVSASFDGSAKVWSARDWRLLNNLQGHDGKVSGVDFLEGGLVTCGYDRTLKTWR